MRRHLPAHLVLLAVTWGLSRFNVRIALTGPTRRMDVGELVTPRQRVPFFSSLAAGFDAAVLMEVVEHVDPPRLEALPVRRTYRLGLFDRGLPGTVATGSFLALVPPPLAIGSIELCGP